MRQYSNRIPNLSLIVIHKGAFGGAKEMVRFPLEQVKVAAGIPQAIAGKSSDGAWQLYVHFLWGVETFTPGVSDEEDLDEEETLTFASLFVSAEEKSKRQRNKVSKREKNNVDTWCAAISHAVLGDVVIAAAPSPNAPAIPIVTSVTARCIGCMAPLSGMRGQKTVCKYCDTEQIVQ